MAQLFKDCKKSNFMIGYSSELVFLKMMRMILVKKNLRSNIKLNFNCENQLQLNCTQRNITLLSQFVTQKNKTRTNSFNETLQTRISPNSLKCKM